MLDVDVAHTRRNLDSILSLIRCVGRGIRGGHLVLGDRWQTLKVPTLFLGAERDVFVRPKFEKALQAIAEGNPNVRLLRIPHAGHLPWLDEPELVVAEIERFLATATKRRGGSGVVATAPSWDGGSCTGESATVRAQPARGRRTGRPEKAVESTIEVVGSP